MPRSPAAGAVRRPVVTRLFRTKEAERGRPQELLLRVNSSYNTCIVLKPFPLSFGSLLTAFIKLASIFLTHILASQKIGFLSEIPNTLLLWHLLRSTIGPKNKSSASGLCPRFSVCELGQVTLPLWAFPQIVAVLNVIGLFRGTNELNSCE